MADILFVTWDGGGNVPPALGIADELQARGHRRPLPRPPSQAPAVAGAGLEFSRLPHARGRSTRPTPATRRSTVLATFSDRGDGRATSLAGARPRGRPTSWWSTACCSA